MPGVHVPISPGHDLTSHRLPAVSCDNRGMKFSWRRLLAATDVLVLALACVNCGGGAAGSTLSSGGGGGSGSGGSNSGGSGGSGGSSGSGGYGGERAKGRWGKRRGPGGSPHR